MCQESLLEPPPTPAGSHHGAPGLPADDADEDALIAWLTHATRGRHHAVIQGIGDDAAWLAGSSAGQVVTTDCLVQGVHFTTAWPARAVGHKLVAVSVSDLAAMGSLPSWATLTMSLPTTWPASLGARGAWIGGFARGLAAALQRWGIALVGGDTTGSPASLFFSLTLAGEALPRPMLRSGAQADDDLWVTGRLGLAGAGWQRQQPPEAATDALYWPDPPVDFAHALGRARLASAAMDLSDGLARDLPRLCAASRCSAVVDPTRLPTQQQIHPHPLSDAHLAEVMGGGEDFQLLFSARRAHAAAITRLAQAYRVKATRIGCLTQAKAPPTLLGASAWPASGFEHFHRQGAA